MPSWNPWSRPSWVEAAPLSGDTGTSRLRNSSELTDSDVHRKFRALCGVGSWSAEWRTPMPFGCHHQFLVTSYNTSDTTLPFEYDIFCHHLPVDGKEVITGLSNHLSSGPRYVINWCTLHSSPTILLFSNEYTQTTTQPPPGSNFYLPYPLTDWNSQCRRPQYLPLLPRLDDDKISRSPGWWCSPKIVCAVCRAARNDFYYYKHLWKWVNLNQIILNDHITNPCWEELLCHMFASYAAAINSHCD